MVCRFGQPIKVNWAYASGQREDTSGWLRVKYKIFMIKQLWPLGDFCSKYNLCFLQFAGHYNIFVGDLSPEVTDATLFACFSVYQSCS